MWSMPAMQIFDAHTCRQLNQRSDEHKDSAIENIWARSITYDAQIF